MIMVTDEFLLSKTVFALHRVKLRDSFCLSTYESDLGFQYPNFFFPLHVFFLFIVAVLEFIKL